MRDIMILESLIQLTDDRATTKFIIALVMRVARGIGSIAEHCKAHEAKSSRPNGDAREL
jgi:hypothetical protein